MYGNSKTQVEEDYPSHKENPGPAPEAFEKKGDTGSGKFLFWLLVVMVIVLIIAWIFF